MTRPNLFIFRTLKCGTTAWVRYLTRHPDIAFASQKEPHYFCEDFPDFRWARTEEEYLGFFENCEGYKVVGEASVQYLYSRLAARKIARFNKDGKILIFLRRQSAFLRSYHNQLVLNLDENIRDFTEAWACSGTRVREALPQTCSEPAFLDYRKVGAFSEQVARYLAVFPRDQVKVVWFEDWTPDPRKAYLEILEFLGLDDDGQQDFEIVHSAKHVASPLLARLTQRPPKVFLAVSRILRRMFALERLGIARRLRKLNTRSGYVGNTEAVNTEIDAYFKEDNRVLDKMLRDSPDVRES